MADEQKRPQVQGAWLKMFCPEARCLTDEEVAALPAEMKKASGAEDKRGLWLEVFCPDDTCLSPEEKLAPLPQVERAKKGGDLWLKIFCPGGSCQLKEGSELS